MKFTIEVKREEDGRWYAVAEEVNGAMLYGDSPEDAAAKTKALALQVVADSITHNDGPMGALSVVVKAEREADGQWRAEYQGIPESAANGATRAEAEAAAKSRALQATAEQLARVGKPHISINHKGE